jgi:hypothetical protein
VTTAAGTGFPGEEGQGKTEATPVDVCQAYEAYVQTNFLTRGQDDQCSKCLRRNTVQSKVAT